MPVRDVTHSREEMSMVVMGRRLFWCVGFLLMFAGCESEESGAENSEQQVDTGVSQRVASYNAGIAEQFVSYASERIAPIADSLGTIEADILCLQEVWSQEAIDAFIEDSKDIFPHSFYELTEEDTSDVEPACTAEAVVPLEECIAENCEGTENLADCGTANCIAEFTGLESACQGCVASNLNLGVEGVISACVSSGGSLSYGGHNGLLLLSRKEIVSPTLTSLPSFLVQRAFILAEVDGLTVGCTHVATPLTPEYNGEFESYEAEQTAQLEIVLEAFEAIEGPVVLMGDMNTGPAQGDLTAEVSVNWGLFSAAGFSNPNTDSESPLCTWCIGNTLSETTVNLAIDHVFVRGAESSEVFRFLDGTTEINVADETLTTSYSDHYGIGTTVTYPAP